MNYSLNTLFKQNLVSTVKDLTSLHQAITDYNDAVFDNYSAIADFNSGKINEEEKNSRISASETKAKTASEIIVELSANEQNFYRQVDQTIITTTPKFIWLTILFIVIYLGLDAGIGFLLFRKRKPKSRPVPKSIPPRDHVYKYDNKGDKE
jgi:hypothetical protein